VETRWLRLEKPLIDLGIKPEPPARGSRAVSKLRPPTCGGTRDGSRWRDRAAGATDAGVARARGFPESKILFAVAPGEIRRKAPGFAGTGGARGSRRAPMLPGSRFQVSQSESEHEPEPEADSFTWKEPAATLPELQLHCQPPWGRVSDRPLQERDGKPRRVSCLSLKPNS